MAKLDPFSGGSKHLVVHFLWLNPTTYQATLVDAVLELLVTQCGTAPSRNLSTRWAAKIISLGLHIQTVLELLEPVLVRVRLIAAYTTACDFPQRAVLEDSNILRIFLFQLCMLVCPSSAQQIPS